MRAIKEEPALDALNFRKENCPPLRGKKSA